MSDASRELHRLMKLHLELDAIRLSSDNRLYPIAGSWRSEIPRFYLVKHAHGYLRMFRHDLPEQLIDELVRVPEAECFHNYQMVELILAHASSCESIHSGKSYIFPASIASDSATGAVLLDRSHRSHRSLIERFDAQIIVRDVDCYGVIIDDELASVCMSSRENQHGGEAWVYTTMKHRNRGYAQQAVAAWAQALLEQGKTPLYTHKMGNSPSQAVAARLGLIEYISELLFY